MRYIVARFNTLEKRESYKEFKTGNYDLLIYENDVIEGTKLLRDSKSYNKDIKAAWARLQDSNIFSSQNDIHYFYNKIEQGITEDKTYYLLIDTFELDCFGFPLIVWVGESLNNKAIENLVFNIQAINLDFVKDFNVYSDIIKNPVACMKLEHLIPHIFIQ